LPAAQDHSLRERRPRMRTSVLVEPSLHLALSGWGNKPNLSKWLIFGRLLICSPGLCDVSTMYIGSHQENFSL
jgi:hypothetical protein